MSKIAVFGNKEDVNRLNLRPKSRFVIIKDYLSLEGHEFIGVITIPNWHYDSDKDYAYTRLIAKFPKLKP